MEHSPERYIKSPRHVLKALGELAKMAARTVDENIYEFNDANFPPLSTPETPVEREDLL